MRKEGSKQTVFKTPALCSAIFNGHIEIVKLFLANGTPYVINDRSVREMLHNYSNYRQLPLAGKKADQDKYQRTENFLNALDYIIEIGRMTQGYKPEHDKKILELLNKVDKDDIKDLLDFIKKDSQIFNPVWKNYLTGALLKDFDILKNLTDEKSLEEQEPKKVMNPPVPSPTNPEAEVSPAYYVNLIEEAQRAEGSPSPPAEPNAPSEIEGAAHSIPMPLDGVAIPSKQDDKKSKPDYEKSAPPPKSKPLKQGQRQATLFNTQVREGEPSSEENQTDIQVATNAVNVAQQDKFWKNIEPEVRGKFRQNAADELDAALKKEGEPDTRWIVKNG